MPTCPLLPHATECLLHRWQSCYLRRMAPHAILSATLDSAAFAPCTIIPSQCNHPLRASLGSAAFAPCLTLQL
jgi:hypothetical protein